MLDSAPVMAAILSVDLSERSYADHWQSVKGQSDNGAKQEALRKLNALLIERDHDLRRYKEKYEQCEKVLKRTQQQLDNLLKKQYQQQLSPTEHLPSVPVTAPDLASTHPLPPAATFAAVDVPAGQVVALQPVEPVSAADRDVAEPRAPSATNGAGLTCRGSARATTSQRNWLLMSHAEPTAVNFSSSSELTSATLQNRPLPQESGFDELDGSCTATLTATPWANVPTTAAAAAVGRPQPKWSQPELQQQPFDRYCTSLPTVTSCGSLPIGVGVTTLQQLAAQPTVSVTVLKNLVKENLRMKKIIDEMKQQEGGADVVHKLMDAADTERLVSRLKQELEAKQRLIDDLQNTLAVGGRFGDTFQQSLSAKVTMLENKVEKLNRLVETKQRTILSLNDSLQKAAGVDGSIPKECTNCCAERKTSETLRKSYEQLVKDNRENVDFLNAQLQVYRDDFAAEHQEKERLRVDYESRLAQSTAVIAQLKTQLQTAGQELPQGRARSDLSHRTVAQELRSSCAASVPRSAGPVLTSAYCFSAASPGVKNDYICPQCHVACSTQSAFQSHIDACLKGSK